jgi:hypothetical protein
LSQEHIIPQKSKCLWLYPVQSNLNIASLISMVLPEYIKPANPVRMKIPKLNTGIKKFQSTANFCNLIYSHQSENNSKF